MYDWPKTAHVLDRFWGYIASSLNEIGISAPEKLERREDLMVAWRDPELLIGQTCGWPYANLLSGKVYVFGCFDHGLSDCEPGEYYSVFIGRDPNDKIHLSSAESLQSAPSVAINLTESQSGFHVFSEISGFPAPDSIPVGNRVMTGSHLGSLEAVASGVATIAAIDAVSFELAKRFHAEWVDQVHVLGQSKPKPALPLITASSLSGTQDQLKTAVSEAIGKLTDGERDTIMVRGIIPRNGKDYDVFRCKSG